MTTWVLILWFHGSFGSAIAMHDFGGKEACESAGVAFKESRGGGAYLCQPKTKPWERN